MTWSEPTPSLAHALLVMGWTSLVNRKCLRSVHWQVVAAEPSFSGLVHFEPQDSPVLCGAAWTEGSLRAQGGAAVVHPDSSFRFGCRAEISRSSTHLRAGREGPRPGAGGHLFGESCDRRGCRNHASLVGGAFCGGGPAALMAGPLPFGYVFGLARLGGAFPYAPYGGREVSLCDEPPCLKWVTRARAGALTTNDRRTRTGLGSSARCQCCPAEVGRCPGRSG